MTISSLRTLLYCLNLFVNHDNIICSRSPFDSIAYSERGNMQQLVDMVNYYMNLALRDTILFYTPIEFEINDSNPLRSLDKEYQREIDEIIYREFEKYKNDNFVILRGSIEERLQTILSVLRRNNLKGSVYYTYKIASTIEDEPYYYYGVHKTSNIRCRLHSLSASSPDWGRCRRQ